MPKARCFGGFRHQRITLRPARRTSSLAGESLGEGEYFMEVPRALPVRLHVNWAKDFANFLPEKPFPQQCMVQAPRSIQPRSSCYGRTLSKKDMFVKIFGWCQAYRHSPFYLAVFILNPSQPPLPTGRQALSKGGAYSSFGKGDFVVS